MGIKLRDPLAEQQPYKHRHGKKAPEIGPEPVLEPVQPEGDQPTLENRLATLAALSGPVEADQPSPVSLTSAGVFRGIPDSDDPLKRDFRLFLVLLWRHLGLSDPTPLQLSIAWYLQHGPDRAIIMAFRGCAKSWITAAYCLWVLYCDPQKKIMVLSGSLKRAVAFTNFCLTIIREWDLLAHLAPLPNQRQSSTMFDVAGVLPDQNPSLHAAGVLGQLAGYRADIIVPDDVETATNSLTVVMREKLAEAVFEFEAILKPNGRIVYLGTPHADDSLYMKLAKERGYSIRIWTARYPTREQITRYGDRLAPYLRDQLKKNPRLAGTPTEPSRFPEAELQKRELGITSAEFQLQYMLDTSLADANRYPLKLRNLMVMALDPRRGPDGVAYGPDDQTVSKNLPAMGFDGDFWYRPGSVADTTTPYNEIVASIDTAGKKEDNSDETSLTIVAELHGMLFVLYNAGWQDGFGPATLKAIAGALVRFNVSTCLVESNYGDGMFVSLLQPVVEEEWRRVNEAARAHNRTAAGPRKDDHGGTTLEEVKSVLVSKEQRILSVLDPLSRQHRIVVAQEVVEGDYRGITSLEGTETRHRYSLWYQFTHLTREKDALAHDDRVDSLAGACGYFAPALGVNPAGMAAKKQREREEEELEALLDDGDEIGSRRKSAGNRIAAASPHKR